MESGGSFTGTEINVQKEAVVYRALAGTPVPVPRVVGVAPSGVALLMERVPGVGNLEAVGEDERRHAVAGLVDVIADLHNLDPDRLDLPGFSRPSTVEEHATVDLDLWRRLAADGVEDLDPMARYAGAFLRHHPPASVARTVLVQGDTGPGNFVVDAGRITALVDMEFAHLGDPMDDLAWILMRTAPWGMDMTEDFGRYAARSSIAVSPRSIAYYEVAVQYRCAVTTSLAVARGGGARGWAPYLLVTQRYLLGLAATLAAYIGVEGPRSRAPDQPVTARTPLYDALLTGLRAAVKAVEEPDTREATRNLQILVHYLRAYDRAGSEVADEDHQDRRDTLGARADADLGIIAEESGAAADPKVLGYLMRRTQRNARLWASLLDRPRR
jgi:aminoglycoside phosphotransferase (APT) family kinase protein